jgi:GxxExxY protein
MTTRLTAAELNRITETIIRGAIEVHRALGPGLLERAYRRCLCHELQQTGTAFTADTPVPITYKGIRIPCGYRADLIVEGVVVVELKAVEAFASIHSRQLYTYLCATGCTVGLLLNFGASTLVDGIKRVVRNFPAE